MRKIQDINIRLFTPVSGETLILLMLHTRVCIEGIRKADSGSILVAGCNPGHDEGKLRSRLGVQLQSSSLPDNITVSEAMALICAWHKLPVREDLLQRFGLAEMKKKQYYSLSTGQKLSLIHI